MPDDNGRTDEELVRDAVGLPGGDVEVFETLVRRHQEKVTANCRYLTRSPADVDDLAQEVFVKVFFNLARFEGRSKFSTWLHRIKVNHCLNFLSRRRGKHFVSVEEPGLESEERLRVPPGADRDLDASDARDRIGAVLDEMTDSLRIPLVLREVDGLSYQEIADSLDLGLSAVKMRIRRGREEFRKRYELLEQGQYGSE